MLEGYLEKFKIGFGDKGRVMQDMERVLGEREMKAEK